MLVGKGWDITAVRADPDARFLPYWMPTGQVTAFYSRYHGDRLLEVEGENVPTYAQPLQMGGIAPAGKVAYVDALATRDDGALYFHAINRHFDESMPIVIDLSAFGEVGGSAVQHILEGRVNNTPGPQESMQIGRVRHEAIGFRGGRIEAMLPPRSVSCIEVEL